MLNAKYLIYSIALLIPIIFQSMILIINIPHISPGTFLLVYSNSFIIPTTLRCLYYTFIYIRNKLFMNSLIIEFILSYTIIFISSLWHLCDSAHVCYSDQLYNLDLILAYSLIATYVFHLIRLNIFFKLCCNMLQITAFYFAIFNNLSILSFYTFPACLIVLKLIERIYKRKLRTFILSHDYKYLIIGCSLLMIAILFGPLQIIQTHLPGLTRYYYLTHSFLWHMPIMLSSLFILDTPIIWPGQIPTGRSAPADETMHRSLASLNNLDIDLLSTIPAIPSIRSINSEPEPRMIDNRLNQQGKFEYNVKDTNDEIKLGSLNRKGINKVPNSSIKESYVHYGNSSIKESSELQNSSTKEDVIITIESLSSNDEHLMESPPESIESLARITSNSKNLNIQVSGFSIESPTARSKSYTF